MSTTAITIGTIIKSFFLFLGVPKGPNESQFEDWADATEQGSLTNDQIDQLKQALSELPTDNDTPKLELGPEGQTAIQFFSDFGLDDGSKANYVFSGLKDCRRVGVNNVTLWLNIVNGITGQNTVPKSYMCDCATQRYN